jgi:hypothetical protein
MLEEQTKAEHDRDQRRIAYWKAEFEAMGRIIDEIERWPDLTSTERNQWYEQAAQDTAKIPYLESRRRHRAFRRTYKTPPGQ